MYIILICLYAIGRGLGGENKTFIIIESLKAKVCYIYIYSVLYDICIICTYCTLRVQCSMHVQWNLSIRTP